MDPHIRMISINALVWLRTSASYRSKREKREKLIDQPLAAFGYRSSREMDPLGWVS